MKNMLPKNAKIIRSGKNAHRFFYFLNGKLNTLQTFKEDIQSSVSDLFGFINQSGVSKNLIKTSMLLALFGMGNAFALPQDGQSVAGNVQFLQNGNTLNISANAARSIANYRSFSIDTNEKVNFNLPSTAAAILNRVTGGDASQILGSMSSNGRIFLVNPNGVFIGQGANINAGGLFATTLNIRDQDFLNNNLFFYKDPNHAPASVVNEGTINIASGGFAALVGSAVKNAGTINAPLGNIQLAVGDQVKAAISDVALVDLKVTEALKNKVDGITSAISNSGTLIADGGLVKMQADLARNIYQQAINQEGMVRAQSVQSKNGVIELLGTSDEQNALVMNTGTLDASGYGQHQTGGSVHVLGDNVSLSGNSKIDASGDAGGGQVRVGGDYQGKGDLHNAQRTLVGENAQIKNDAITTGDGGKSIVWADDAAFYYGSISAKGGNQSGNGGFVETSGKNGLDFRGLVDTTAPKGKVGQTLLDPFNLTIVESGGINVVSNATFANQPSTNMTINASNVNTVGATSNVTLQANNNLTFNNTVTPISLGAGRNLTGQAGNNITVNGLLTANQITLQAGNNINVNRNIKGNNGVRLTADAALPTIPVPTVSNNVGNIVLGANIASNTSPNPSIPIQNILSGVNIIQNSGALAVDSLEVNLHGGGDATLTQVNNNINALSGHATGPNTQNSTLSYTDTNGFRILTVNSATALDMGNGNLVLTALHGGNISTDPVTPSTVHANRLEVNLDGGGDSTFAQRRTITHDVNIFAANATGANTQNTSVNFSDIDGFAVNTSNLHQGSLTLAAINGGSITQTDPITANQLSVAVAGGGDVTLTRPDNNINTFLAGTTVPFPGFPTPPPVNTQNTVINFTNAHGFGVNQASLNRGKLILTALNGGNITQTGAITGNSLVVNVSGGGDATLNRTDNNVNIFATNITGTNTQNSVVSYTDINEFAVDKSILNNGKLILSALNGGNITQNGAITGNSLAVNMSGGGDATLTRTDNNVGVFSANASGINTQNSVVSYTDTNGFAVDKSILNNGKLILTALNGGNITQPGAITGNSLAVNMSGGGDATLTRTDNNVNVFAGNITGANSQNTLISYTDTNGFTVAKSDLLNGRMTLNALNGGNIDQNGAISGIIGSILMANVDGGGDILLNRTDNNVKAFGTNATGNNTQNTEVTFVDANDFAMVQSALNKGTLNLTTLRGNITQTGPITGDSLTVTVNNGGKATLNRSDNNFKNFATNILGNNTNQSIVTYVDADDITLGKSILNQGILRLTAGGNISQSGEILGGNVGITLNKAATVNLTNPDNNFRFFAVKGTLGETVSLFNKGSLSLLNSSLGSGNSKGNLNITTTGLLTIPAGNTIFANTQIKLRASDINILGTVKVGLQGSQQKYPTTVLELAPNDPNSSIGLGGASGAFNISQDEFNRLSGAQTLQIGSKDTAGKISLGSVNLSKIPITLTLNTLGTISDSTPNNDSAANLIMATNKNLMLTGGYTQGGGPVPPVGAKQIGAPGLGDIDVTFAGSSFADVKIRDFSGVGRSFNVTTPLGGVYMNVPPSP